jgi:hypothetical protein
VGTRGQRLRGAHRVDPEQPAAAEIGAARLGRHGLADPQLDHGDLGKGHLGRLAGRQGQHVAEGLDPRSASGLTDDRQQGR